MNIDDGNVDDVETANNDEAVKPQNEEFIQMGPIDPSLLLLDSESCNELLKTIHTCMDIIDELMSETTEYGSHQTVDINTSCGVKKGPSASNQNTTKDNSKLENVEYYQEHISILRDVPCNPVVVDALTTVQDETICCAICGDKEIESSTSIQTMAKDNSEREKLKQCYQELISIITDVPTNNSVLEAMAPEDGEEISEVNFVMDFSENK